MTEPTEGLVPVWPRLLRPMRSAAAIMRRSNSGSTAIAAAFLARVAIGSVLVDLHGLRLPSQLVEHRLEVFGVTEVAIHRSETDVGDLVEVLEAFHHQAADALGGHVTVAGRFQLPDDAIDHAFNAFLLHGPLPERQIDRTRQFITVERGTAPALLDHGQLAQLHALESRESATAIGAY